MPSKNFRDLTVWRRARQWVLDVYRFTACFPGKEQFGLTSQLRREAISVPANIAEGSKRNGNSDKARFYNIAQGSMEECRYYLILAKDLGYGDTRMLEGSLEKISRLLEAYAGRLTKS
jgi:four helix bundle protein